MRSIKRNCEFVEIYQAGYDRYSLSNTDYVLYYNKFYPAHINTSMYNMLEKVYEEIEPYHPHFMNVTVSEFKKLKYYENLIIRNDNESVENSIPLYVRFRTDEYICQRKLLKLQKMKK